MEGTEGAQFEVTGAVQGVGYRSFVVDQAERLGLRGWVRNRRDGSVEVAASGPAAALRELEQALWRGPAAARVAGVLRRRWEAADCPPGFEIVRA